MLIRGRFVLVALLFRHATPSFALPSRAESSVAKRVAYDSSHKAGLGWTDTSVNVSQFTSKVSWYYDWTPQPPYLVSAMDGLEFVPMFWGNKSIPQFGGVPGLASSGSIDAVLGMNEPTVPGQSELSPAQGAELWMQYIEPLKQANSSIRLGSPAMANGPAGIPWVQQFMGNCTSCSVDFIVLHYYYINATDFINYLYSYHDTFNKPIWVTEWGCVNFGDASNPCPDDYIPQFMNETQTFMDSTDWVERYAWFGAFKTMPGGLSPALQLIDSNGTITPLGLQYIGNTTGGTPSNGTGDGKKGGGKGGNGGGNTGGSFRTYSFGAHEAASMLLTSMMLSLGCWMVAF